jgi:hypothetical protein
VYGATAGVSVVQLYAGAFFPGLMLAGLYILYVVLLAKLRPSLMPPLSAADRHVPLPPVLEQLQAAAGKLALPALLAAFKGSRNSHLPMGVLWRNLIVTLLPVLVFVAVLGLTWRGVTAPPETADDAGLQQMGGAQDSGSARALDGTEPKAEGVSEPPAAQESSGAPGVQEPPAEGVKEPPAEGLKEPPGAGRSASRQAARGELPGASALAPAGAGKGPRPRGARRPALGLAGGGAPRWRERIRFHLRAGVFKMLLGRSFAGCPIWRPAPSSDYYADYAAVGSGGLLAAIGSELRSRVVFPDRQDIGDGAGCSWISIFSAFPMAAGVIIENG